MGRCITFSIYDVRLQASTELGGTNENVRNNRRISGKTRGYNPYPLRSAPDLPFVLSFTWLARGNSWQTATLVAAKFSRLGRVGCLELPPPTYWESSATLAYKFSGPRILSLPSPPPSPKFSLVFYVLLIRQALSCSFVTVHCKRYP